MCLLLLVGSALLLGFLSTGECIKFVQIEVPKIVDPRSEKIILYCDYDLAGKGLFSVNWFKGDDEFFRYIPNSASHKFGKPLNVDAYNVNGIQVNLDESNDKRVVLQQHEGDKWANLGGMYACQVTAEGPTFDTKFDVANISVGVLPQRDPALEGLRTHYDVGDVLTAECTSAPSYPPAELSFHLNNIPVKKTSMRQLPDEGPVEGAIVSTTRLGLSLSLQRHDFNAVGSLSLVCRSILPGIPGAKARETKAIVYLTTSNEKFAQEAITKFSSSAAAAACITTTSTAVGIVITQNIIVAKCAEYGKLVYADEAAPVLRIDAGTNVVSKCGIIETPLIVGGIKAKPREFPHMAVIGYGKEIFWQCGGAVISENFILTAAHCVDSVDRGPAIKVRVGLINVKDAGATMQERNIINRQKHPDYKLPSRYNDIALLKLDKPLNLNANVRPACLESESSLSEKHVIASGFGKTSYEAEKGSDDLMKVTLNYISSDVCKKYLEADLGGKLMPQGFVPSILCAGVLEGGKDTCQGDSGGPIQRVLTEPYCMYSIVGITSFGKFCAFKNSPAVYTRVNSYLDWIEKIVWSDTV